MARTMNDPEVVVERVWSAISLNSERIDLVEAVAKERIDGLESIVNTRNEMMRDSILSAVREAMPSSLLSDDEHRWVKLAIEKEAQSIKYRRAVIQHTTTALLWAAIVGAGVILREWAVARGLWKP